MDTWRFMGVLQRMGVSFFFTGMITLITTPTSEDLSTRNLRPSKLAKAFKDILPYWKEWLIIISMVITWILLTFLTSVDGCGKGYIGPGGLHDHGKCVIPSFFRFILGDKLFFLRHSADVCTGGFAGY